MLIMTSLDINTEVTYIENDLVSNLLKIRLADIDKVDKRNILTTLINDRRK